MQRIVEYKVVSGKLDVVVNEVNEMIKDGWQPFGECQDSSSEDNYLGMQTMVKYASPHLAPR